MRPGIFEVRSQMESFSKRRICPSDWNLLQHVSPKKHRCAPCTTYPRYLSSLRASPVASLKANRGSSSRWWTKGQKSNLIFCRHYIYTWPCASAGSRWRLPSTAALGSITGAYYNFRTFYSSLTLYKWIGGASGNDHEGVRSLLRSLLYCFCWRIAQAIYSHR